MTTARDLLARHRFVPVLTFERPETAVAVARALLAGGVGALEITLRRPAAVDCIASVARELPDMAVGAGTVLKAEDVERSRLAGARFLVSPGLTPDLAEAARASGLPWLPGAITPSEIMRARELGLDTLKFFPAVPAGGTAALQALAPVFPDVAFCPTGGIGEAEMAAWYGCANVAAIGGSWVAPAKLVDAADWAGITALAVRAAALAR